MDRDVLIAAARDAREKAYAPYSHYLVGAAVMGSNGGIWTGCNVENASYGATICAERVAVVKMVSEGSRELKALALVTENGQPPCGICLQFLLEFAPDPSQVLVLLVGKDIQEHTLAELIPIGFRLN